MSILACALLSYSVKSQKLPNFHPFHHYPVFAHTASGPRKSTRKTSLKVIFHRSSLHRCDSGEKNLLTKGGLGLGPCTGEGRGTSYAVSI